MIIQIPHFQQSAPGFCLAACAKMILAGMNRYFTEAELDKVMGGVGEGVPSFAVQRLARLDLQIEYRRWTITEMGTMIQQNTPAIAFVSTQFLDHWSISSAHAVVIVGMDEQKQFWIHDPDLPTGPTLVSWNGFLAAWFEFDQRGTTIRQTRKRL